MKRSEAAQNWSIVAVATASALAYYLGLMTQGRPQTKQLRDYRDEIEALEQELEASQDRNIDLLRQMKELRRQSGHGVADATEPGDADRAKPGR